MNGLRALERKYENRRFRFHGDKTYNNATTIEVLPDVHEPGVVQWRTQTSVDDLFLAKFLERGGLALNTPGRGNELQDENKHATPGTKIIMIPWRLRGGIMMSEQKFMNLLKTINPDPLQNRIFHNRYYRYFDASGSIADGGTAALHIRFMDFWFMLSIQQHEDDPAFNSRCICIKAVNRDEPPKVIADDYLSDCLELLKEEARSPLYLPFALSVHRVRICRTILRLIDQDVGRLQSMTQFGSLNNEYDQGAGIPTDRAKFVKLNGMIGGGLDHVANATGTLNGLETLWKSLEAMAKEIPLSARIEQVVQSTDNILEAIGLLRQEVQGMKESLRDAELRIRNFALIISAHISQQDSATNIEAAIASRDLAKAASEDSSAMKSIAILTMFFLPGTFFAALFAMPSVGWDQPRHFRLYWAFTIPATVLTFAIWAVLTQRAVVVRWAKTLSLNWPWRFWRRAGKVGDEEEGKKVV